MQRFRRLSFFTKYALSSNFKDKSNFIYNNQRSFSESEKRCQPIISITDTPPNQMIRDEDLIEKIKFCIEKKDLKEIVKIVDEILENKIKIDKKILYLILNNSYDKDFKLVKKIHLYLNLFDSEFDSVLYSFLIMAYLRNESFQESFKLLTKCCSEGFQPLVNVLVELYNKLIDENQIITSQKLEYKNFIDVQVKLFYNYEQYNAIFRKLSDQFNANENIKSIEQKKGKKKRTLNELLTKINIEKNYLNFPSNIDNLRSSKEELFKALAEEIRERDEKEPKK